MNKLIVIAAFLLAGIFACNANAQDNWQQRTRTITRTYYAPQVQWFSVGTHLNVNRANVYQRNGRRYVRLGINAGVSNYHYRTFTFYHRR